MSLNVIQDTLLAAAWLIRRQSQAAEWWISTSGAWTRGSGSVKCINAAPKLLIMQDEKVVDMLLCGSLNDSPAAPEAVFLPFPGSNSFFSAFLTQKKSKQW